MAENLPERCVRQGYGARRGLLLCSAALFYIGYVRWNLAWLGNVAATVIVASITAVVIDRVIVGYRRRRLTAVIDSARRQLGDRCDDLVVRVNSIRDEAANARPKPPYLIAGGYTPSGVDNSWGFALNNLDEALVAWAVLTGYSHRSVHMDAIDTALAELRNAYTDAMDASARVMAQIKANWSALDELFGQSMPKPDESLMVAANGAIDRVSSAASAAVASIDALKADAGREDMARWIKRKRPFRLPSWLQVATLIIATAWTAILISASLTPTGFPPNFTEDNILNIAANAAIALFAGTLTIALVQHRRVVVAAHALPTYTALTQICAQLTLLANPSRNADLRATLVQATERISTLSLTIQSECASAELSFWTTLITTKMRRLAAVDTPLSVSETDAVSSFFGSFRPSSHPGLDADTQAMFAQQSAKANIQPAAPSRELIDFLEDLSQFADAARAAANLDLS